MSEIFINKIKRFFRQRSVFLAATSGLFALVVSTGLYLSPFGEFLELTLQQNFEISVLSSNYLPINATKDNLPFSDLEIRNITYFLSLIFILASSCLLTALFIFVEFWDFLWITAGISILTITGGLVSYKLYGFVLPWTVTIFSVICSSAFLTCSRWIHKFSLQQKIKYSLSGLIPNEDNLHKNPLLLNYNPSEHIVTVMMIHLNGLSQTAERQAPSQIFEQINSLYSLITGIIKTHNGIINKIIGDDLICFFGYSYVGQDAKDYQASHALACAREIQKQTVSLYINKTKSEPIYPVSIGINTCSLYLGNIALGNRIDINLIGHGMEFTKRLTESCEPFKIMFSATTRDLCTKFQPISHHVAKRHITLKFFDQLISAYEYNPFADNDAILQHAIKMFRDCSEIIRLEERHPVPQFFDFYVKTADGTVGQLINFSLSGIAFKTSTQYLAKKVSLLLYFGSKGQHPCPDLTPLGNSPLIGEICWGRPVKDGFIHGVLITNLTDQQRQLFEETLRAEVRKAIQVA